MKSESSRRQSSGGKKRSETASKTTTKRTKTSSQGESVWKILPEEEKRPRRGNSDRSTGKPQRSTTRSAEGTRSTSFKKRGEDDDTKRPNRSGAKRIVGKNESSFPSKERKYTADKKYTTDSDRPKRAAGKRVVDKSESPFPTKERKYTSDRKYTTDSDRPKRIGDKRVVNKSESPFPVKERKYAADKKYTADGDRPKRSSSRQRPSERNEGYDTDKRIERRSANSRYSDTPKKVITRGKKSNTKDGVRLNKFIANSGICSRREADNFIEAGVVSVNGEVISTLGTKVKPSDDVRFNGQRLQGEKKVYILLNKPKGYVTTVEDPHADKTVMDLIEGACSERVYPVGRLDKNTTGVLLFTNDGELTKQLTHPSNEKMKIYHVFLDKNFTRNDLTKLVEGLNLEDGLIQADSADYVDDDKAQVGIEIHSGRNRIVRRMFEHLGYKVIKLDRVYFAGLTKKGLKRGEWRILNQKEANMLKMGAYK